MPRFHLIFGSLIFIAISSSSTFAQSTWSSFQNAGTPIEGSVGIPSQWSPDGGITWSLNLAGYGQSSPVVYDGTVFVTSVTGENKETLNVQAISLDSGEQEWVFNHENSSPEKNTIMVSRAAPTPIVDDQGVIAFFEGGNLIALDHKGEVRWKRDLVDEFGAIKARHGIAASLEQDANHIYLWCERMESPYVMAIQKSDGETVWKTKGLGNTSWSSPRLLDVGDDKHLVLSSIGLIVGVDPETGDRLWEFDKVASNSSSTPVPVGNGKFLMGASQARGGQKAEPSCGVISIEKSDDGFAARWDWIAEKATCSFGSPFAFDGKAWFVNRSGIVHCHDLTSGKEVFAKRLGCGQIWATPLATKDRIYFFGKGGKTSIVAAGEEFNVISDNELWKPEKKDQAEEGSGGRPSMSGSVLYAGVVSNDTLLLRRGDILYAVR